MKTPALSTPFIIHAFAAAHALVAILSRVFNYVDDVPLTVLTISMIVIISIRRGLQVEAVAVLALICSFVGYLVGIYGAQLIDMLIRNRTIAPAITTALITEVIGWGVYGFGRLVGTQTNNKVRYWSPTTMQIVVIASAILLLRISYTLIFSSPYFEQGGIYPEFQRLLGNTFAMVTLLCGNIIYVNLRPRKIDSRELRNAVTIAFIALFSLLITLVVYFDLPQGNSLKINVLHMFRLYAVILLADIVVYTLLQLINYALSSKAELRSERGKKHRAQYQYSKLKMQINPHFLFNSLNILDFLVQEHETERAGAFIRKLAGTYRYMLKNEDESLVRLEEELDFAQKYIDLLQERFADGFHVETDIPHQALRRHIVPCCLQLLIENATKHNIVSTEQPLTIRIGVEDGMLVVRNKLQPRISSQASTGIGLRNIRQQYRDISDREIVVEKTKTEFSVKLPLL